MVKLIQDEALRENLIQLKLKLHVSIFKIIMHINADVFLKCIAVLYAKSPSLIKFAQMWPLV